MTYLQNGEPSRILAGSSLIIFTKSRLNLKPEKLHSEGKANKLYASPASGKWNEIKSNSCTLSRTLLKISVYKTVSYNSIPKQSTGMNMIYNYLSHI